MTIDEVKEQIERVKAEKDREIKELEAIAAQQKRVYDESELAQRKRAEIEAAEQARQAKLALWRESALQPAKAKIDAVRAKYEAWRSKVEAIAKTLAELQIELNAMTSELISVPDALVKATVAQKWINIFESDAALESFVNAEVEKIVDQRFQLAWPSFPALKNGQDGTMVITTIRVDLHGHVQANERRTPQKSFVKTDEQIMKETLMRRK